MFGRYLIVFLFWPILCPHAQAESSCLISPEKELVINHLKVVEDARTKGVGPWTFGKLIANLTPAGKIPEDFALEFFNTWISALKADTTDFYALPNGSADNPDPNAAKDRWAVIERIVADWPKTASGKLDLSKSPFRLLAITNRVDLDGQGEGRFVFTFTDSTDPEEGQLDGTVIFEYQLPLGNGSQTKSYWANLFHGLAKYSLGSAQYLTALESITSKFSGPGNGLINGQVRTNEQLGDDKPGPEENGNKIPVWQLREFRLASGKWVESTVKNNPHLDYNTYQCSESNPTRCIQKLQDYIVANETALLNGTFKLDTSKILEGKTAPANAPGFKWLGGLAPPSSYCSKYQLGSAACSAQWEPVRKAFGVTTCNGCHAGDGFNIEKNFVAHGFTHISMRNVGETSTLSKFLQQDIINVRVPNMTALVCPAGTPGAKLSSGRAVH